MNIRRKAPLIVIATAFATSAVSAYFSYGACAAHVETAKRRELEGVARLIQNSIQESANKAAARASLLAGLPSVEEAFRSRDREQLARRLVPPLLIQRELYGVQEAQFHLAPATSFLRMFALNDGHDEDLSSFREMVVAANRKQESQKGIEIGRRGLSIRGVEVVKDAQGPIGSFEIGMSFGSVLEDTKSNTGFDVAVFADDLLMTRLATLSPRPDGEKIIGGYRCVDSTNWRVFRGLVSPDLMARSNDVAHKHAQLGAVDYGVTVVPLLDYKGTAIGSIVAARNFEEFQAQLRGSFVRVAAFALLQVILLTGSLLFVLNGMVMRPLIALTERLAKLAKGEPDPSPLDLAKEHDEVGELARTIAAVGTLAEKRKKGARNMRRSAGGVRLQVTMICAVLVAITAWERAAHADSTPTLVATMALLASDGAAPERLTKPTADGPVARPPAPLVSFPENVPTPLRVGVAVDMTAIAKLNEGAGTFEASMDVRLRWRDPRLAFDRHEAGTDRRDFAGEAATAKLATIWTPGITVANLSDKPNRLETGLQVFEDGTVYLIQRLRAPLETKYRLAGFPFDTQALCVRLLSTRYNIHEIDLVQDQSDLDISGLHPDMTVTGWTPLEMDFSSSRLRAWNGESLPEIRARVLIQRESLSHLLAVFPPLFLILLVPTVVTLYAKAEVAPRLTAWSASILALIALNFTLGSRYPSLDPAGLVAQSLAIACGYQFLMTVLTVTLLNPPVAERIAHKYEIAELTAFVRWGLPCLVCGVVVARALLTALG